jgi:hypothetical protein
VEARSPSPAGTEVATATALVSSLNPSLFGVPVTFTATVTTVLGGNPVDDGSVTFSIDGIVQIAVDVGVDGVATHTVTALGPGDHTVRADYGGVQNRFNASSGSSSQRVDLRPTTTTLTPSRDSIAFGESVTFTASVSDSTSGQPVSGGSVTFTINGGGAVTEAVVGGTAALTTNTLPIGASTIRAVYNPAQGGVLAGSEASFPFQVNAPATVTTLTSSPNPSRVGQSITFTATVTSGGTAVTDGSVTFTVGLDELGTAAVDGNGVATIATAQLGSGQHQVAAFYSGSNHFSSSSGSLTQQVDALPTLTVLTSSSNPSTVGDAVTFTARVFFDGTVPDGQVAFIDGSTVLDTVTLDNTATATFTTSTLDAGTHTITAAYQGSTNFSASSTELTQQVDGSVGGTSTSTPSSTPTSTSPPTSTTPSGSVPTTTGPEPTTTMPTAGTTTTTTSEPSVGTRSTSTALTSSANPSVVGEEVTFAIEVSSPGGGPIGFARRVAAPPPPGGSVTISDGITVLAVVDLEGGRAEFTTSSLTAGTHTITAAFSGTATAERSSDTMVQQVNPAVELPATR